MNQGTWNKYLKELGSYDSEFSDGMSEEDFHPKPIVDDIETLLKLPDVKTILCVGCGFGQEVYLFKKKGFDSCGITLSNVDIDIGKKMGLDLRLMDIHELEFDNKSFDLVFVRQVFEHALSHYILMSEFSRVVKDNGYVAIFLPYIYEWSDYERHTIVPTRFQLTSLARKFGLILKDHFIRVSDERKWNSYIYLFKKEV